jgi:hypothetical protein
VNISNKRFFDQFISGEHDGRGGGTILSIPGNDVIFQEFFKAEIFEIPIKILARICDFIPREHDGAGRGTLLPIPGNDVIFQEFLVTEIEKIWSDFVILYQENMMEQEVAQFCLFLEITSLSRKNRADSWK